MTIETERWCTSFWLTTFNCLPKSTQMCCGGGEGAAGRGQFLIVSGLGVSRAAFLFLLLLCVAYKLRLSTLIRWVLECSVKWRLLNYRWARYFLLSRDCHVPPNPQSSLHTSLVVSLVLKSSIGSVTSFLSFQWIPFHWIYPDHIPLLSIHWKHWLIPTLTTILHPEYPQTLSSDP